MKAQELNDLKAIEEFVWAASRRFNRDAKAASRNPTRDTKTVPRRFIRDAKIALRRGLDSVYTGKNSMPVRIG